MRRPSSRTRPRPGHTRHGEPQAGDRGNGVVRAHGRDRGIVVALDGSSLCALVEEPPGVALPNLGALPLAHRSLATSRTLARGDGALASHARALDEWRVLTAALLVGAGWRALRIAIDYTTNRKAFGVPIATYQAVNHRMADLATGLTGARLLMRRAAWEVDRDGERASTLASMAFAFCANRQKPPPARPCTSTEATGS